MDYNCFLLNAFTNVANSGGSHSLLATNPLFVTDGSDFHLLSTSPCINAGTDVGLTEDYEGNAVPQGATPDIGAYEYIILVAAEGSQVQVSDTPSLYLVVAGGGSFMLGIGINLRV